MRCFITLDNFTPDQFCRKFHFHLFKTNKAYPRHALFSTIFSTLAQFFFPCPQNLNIVLFVGLQTPLIGGNCFQSFFLFIFLFAQPSRSRLLGCGFLPFFPAAELGFFRRRIGSSSKITSSAVSSKTF